MKLLFLFSAFSAFLITSQTLPAAESTKPNVLFISLDDLNDWVGCLGGHAQTKTPNIDRLAKSGVLFTNAHCAAPSCNPSRSSLFTGVPPYRSGLYSNAPTQKLRTSMPDAVLLPRHFSNNGYWSAGAGKLLHYIIDVQSWDDYFPEKTKENPFPRIFNPPNRPISLPMGIPNQYVETDWAALDVSDEEYGGDWLVTKWVGEQFAQKREKPFFLGCGIYKPHEPWFVPKKYFEPFPLESIQPGPGYKADDLDDLPPSGQQLGRNRYFDYIQKQGQWKKGIQAYLAAIHYADAMVGRVLDALERSPARDNTIVVLWSDHGWHLGEKEHWQKYTGWRLCTRVPLIIRVPKGAPGLPEGTQEGVVCDQSVSLTDLYRTLSDLCGLPASGNEDAAEISLVPLLRDPKTAWPHAAITQFQAPGTYAVSRGNWRYIHYRKDNEELYDIATDPHEWTNLLHGTPAPENRQRADELRALAPANPAPITAAPATSKVEAKWHPASEGVTPPSKPRGDAVEVLFANPEEQPAHLVWLKPGGGEKSYGVIESSKGKRLKSRLGTAWELRSSKGDRLGYYVISEVIAAQDWQSKPKTGKP